MDEIDINFPDDLFLRNICEKIRMAKAVVEKNMSQLKAAKATAAALKKRLGEWGSATSKEAVSDRQQLDMINNVVSDLTTRLTKATNVLNSYKATQEQNKINCLMYDQLHPAGYKASEMLVDGYEKKLQQGQVASPQGMYHELENQFTSHSHPITSYIGTDPVIQVPVKRNRPLKALPPKPKPKGTSGF